MTMEEFYNSLEQSAYIDHLDNCCRIETNLTKLINQIFDEHEAQLKAERKKARSIVAMLFWEWRRLKIIAREKKYSNSRICKTKW